MFACCHLFVVTGKESPLMSGATLRPFICLVTSRPARRSPSYGSTRVPFVDDNAGTVGVDEDGPEGPLRGPRGGPYPGGTSLGPSVSRTVYTPGKRHISPPNGRSGSETVLSGTSQGSDVLVTPPSVGLPLSGRKPRGPGII